MLPRPFWLRQQGPNACLKELGPRGIGELANWERMIRNRSEAKYKMMFHENLLRRSRLEPVRRRWSFAPTACRSGARHTSC